MKRLLPLMAVACLTTEAQTRTFDVASIRLATFPSQSYFEGWAASGTCGWQKPKIDGPRVALTKTTICGLIRIAYGLQPYQVLDAPNWMMESKPELY